MLQSPFSESNKHLDLPTFCIPLSSRHCQANSAPCPCFVPYMSPWRVPVLHTHWCSSFSFSPWDSDSRSCEQPVLFPERCCGFPPPSLTCSGTPGVNNHKCHKFFSFSAHSRGTFISAKCPNPFLKCPTLKKKRNNILVYKLQGFFRIIGLYVLKEISCLTPNTT